VLVRACVLLPLTSPNTLHSARVCAAAPDISQHATQDDAGDCEDLYGSAYVMTIMPEPVDYFMRCASTFDCRARCLDTHEAFEDALAVVKRSGREPTYTQQTPVVVQSKYFSSYDIDAGRHRPPFAVHRVHELAPAVCRAAVCGNAGSRHSKCLAAVGLDTSDHHAPSVAIAYFCVPLDVAQFVTVYRGLPFKAGTREYALATGAELLGTHLLTTARVAETVPRRELLLTLSRNDGVWGLDVLEPAPVRLSPLRIHVRMRV